VAIASPATPLMVMIGSSFVELAHIAALDMTMATILTVIG
jgi:hypothetical protein